MPQDEARLLQVITDLKEYGPVLLVVDQPGGAKIDARDAAMVVETARIMLRTFRFITVSDGQVADIR